MKKILFLLFFAFLLVSCAKEPIVCKDMMIECFSEADAIYSCGKYIKYVGEGSVFFITHGCLPESQHTSFQCPPDPHGPLEARLHPGNCDEAIHLTCELIKECP